MSDNWPEPDSTHRSLASLAYQSTSVAFTPLPEYVHNRAVWLGYFRAVEQNDRDYPHVPSADNDHVVSAGPWESAAQMRRHARRLRDMTDLIRSMIFRQGDKGTARDDARREHERTLERCPCRRCNR